MTVDQPHPPDGLALWPLSPAFGAEVVGLDPGALASPWLGPFLHQALLDHQLLLLRGLDLDPASFRRLAVRLGPLRLVPGGMQVEPDMPDVQRLSNLGPDGAPRGVNPDSYSLNWHSDGSATRIPSRYTLLCAVRIPNQGGETSFVDMYAACAALPPARRRDLIGRYAIHDPDLARVFRYGRAVGPAAASLRRRLWMRIRFLGRMISWRTASQPVIRMHEETGRPALYLGDHALRVTRCWWPAGGRLVNELNTFATTHPEWIYTHSWRVGDLLIWDNRCLLHRGSAYDTAGQARVMLRAVVDGVGLPIAAPA